MTTSARVIRDENFGISPDTLAEFKKFAKKPDITPKELATLIKRNLQIYEEENKRIINAKHNSHTPSRFSKLSNLLNNIKHPVSSRISQLLKKLRTPEKKLIVEGVSPPLSSSSPSKGGYNSLKYKYTNILKKQPKKPIKLKH